MPADPHSRRLLALMSALHRAASGTDPEWSFVAALLTSAEDNGLDRELPAWLVDAFVAALARRDSGPAAFPNDNGDVASFLSEVSKLVPGWNHDDQGEWYDMTFPALGMWIHVSREARDAEGRGCSSWTVKPLPADGALYPR